MTFVERSPKAYEVIKKNLIAIRADERARLMREDVYRIRPTGEEDFIFCAPPYPEIERMPGLARQLALGAKPACQWILQHPKSYNISEIENTWNLLQTRIYGKNALSFFEFTLPTEPGPKKIDSA